MKILDTSPITTITNGTSPGMPIKAGTLDFLQCAYKEITNAAIQAIMKGNYQANTLYRLYGCEYTITVLTQFLRTFTITAGAVFYNGEVYFVDDTPTFTYWVEFETVLDTAIVITPYENDADPVVFTDGISRYVHNIRKIVFSAKTALTPAPNGLTTNSLYPVLPVDFEPQWQPLTLSTSPIVWTNLSSNFFSAAYLQEYNKISLTGAVTTAIPAPGTFTLFTLPTPPTKQILIPARAWYGTTGPGGIVGALTALAATDIMLFINTDGTVQINPATSYGVMDVFLDGITFRIK
jgi:hypothetical protein